MFKGFFTEKEPKSCINLNLGNTIKLVGFDTLKLENIKLYKSQDQKESIVIDELIHYRDSSYHFGDIDIVLNENLFSKEDYNLLLNTIHYRLTDFKVNSRLVMKGIKKDSLCSLVSFKINNIENYPIYGGNQIQIKKHE